MLERAKPVLRPSDYITPRGLKGDVFAFPTEPFSCATCSESVTSAASLWICHSCGEYRSPSCWKPNETKCPSCGAQNTDLNLPSHAKAERGRLLALDREGVIPQSRRAVHLVEQGAFSAFIMGNKLKQGRRRQELYTYAVQCYNWIQSAHPEWFHGGGFDSSLIRALAMRHHAEGDEAETQRLVWAAPEVFVNQKVLPVPPVESNPVQQHRRGLMGEPKTLFVDLPSEDKAAGVQDPWVREGVIQSRMEGPVSTAMEKLKRKNGVAMTNTLWVFPTELAAAEFVTSQYGDASEGLPIAQHVLSVGTDCIAFVGTMNATSKGERALFVIYSFREQNVAVKIGMHRLVRGSASGEALSNAINQLRLAAFSHSIRVQQMLESHPVTRPNKRRLTDFFSSWRMRE